MSPYLSFVLLTTEDPEKSQRPDPVDSGTDSNLHVDLDKQEEELAGSKAGWVDQLNHGTWTDPSAV